jgi:DsbC/DsbD-like thiol-disulfide interchange protein
MRTILFLLSSAVFVVNANAQDPVKWVFTSKKISGRMYEIKLTATVSNGWHIYSQSTPSGGPAATTIVFSKHPLIETQGNIKEIGDMHKKFEETFDVDVWFFNNKVEFVQVVQLKTNAKTNLSGTIEYMVCNDEKCLPPKTVPFSIAIQ